MVLWRSYYYFLLLLNLHASSIVFRKRCVKLSKTVALSISLPFHRLWRFRFWGCRAWCIHVCRRCSFLLYCGFYGHTNIKHPSLLLLVLFALILLHRIRTFLPLLSPGLYVTGLSFPALPLSSSVCPFLLSISSRQHIVASAKGQARVCVPLTYLWRVGVNCKVESSGRRRPWASLWLPPRPEPAPQVGGKHPAPGEAVPRLEMHWCWRLGGQDGDVTLWERPGRPCTPVLINPHPKGIVSSWWYLTA